MFSEVLNLSVVGAMSKEIKRIAAQEGKAESEAARMLLEWELRPTAREKLRSSNSLTTATVPWTSRENR